MTFNITYIYICVCVTYMCIYICITHIYDIYIYVCVWPGVNLRTHEPVWRTSPLLEVRGVFPCTQHCSNSLWTGGCERIVVASLPESQTNRTVWTSSLSRHTASLLTNILKKVLTSHICWAKPAKQRFSMVFRCFSWYFLNKTTTPIEHHHHHHHHQWKHEFHFHHLIFDQLHFFLIQPCETCLTGLNPPTFPCPCRLFQETTSDALIVGWLTSSARRQAMQHPPWSTWLMCLGRFCSYDSYLVLHLTVSSRK